MRLITDPSNKYILNIYERFLSLLEAELEKSVGKGIFGADMKVELLNDGPVTIIVDSKLKF